MENSLPKGPEYIEKCIRRSNEQQPIVRQPCPASNNDECAIEGAFQSALTLLDACNVFQLGLRPSGAGDRLLEACNFDEGELYKQFAYLHNARLDMLDCMVRADRYLPRREVVDIAGVAAVNYHLAIYYFAEDINAAIAPRRESERNLRDCFTKLLVYFKDKPRFDLRRVLAHLEIEHEAAVAKLTSVEPTAGSVSSHGMDKDPKRKNVVILGTDARNKFLYDQACKRKDDGTLLTWKEIATNLKQECQKFPEWECIEVPASIRAAINRYVERTPGVNEIPRRKGWIITQD